jgi:hypothetical protein
MRKHLNILRFEMNVPTDVVLGSCEGVAIEGRYGTRAMFPLADGRVMYVPPIVASKIHAEGIVPGERFQICKAVVRIGQKRSVEWLLQRVDSDQPAEPLADVIEAAAPETQLERDLRASVERADANKAELRLQPKPCACIEEIPPFPPTPISNGYAGRNAPGKPCDTPSEAASPPVTKLEHALKTAISAAHNAEKFGSELGYVVRFDADAIKSMAITVLINMSERSPR